MHTSAKLDYLIKWEQDFQKSLKFEEWHSIAQIASKSLINTSNIEANYKVLLRYYMVPIRLATYVLGVYSKVYSRMRSTGRNGIPYLVSMPQGEAILNPSLQYIFFPYSNQSNQISKTCPVGFQS